MQEIKTSFSPNNESLVLDSSKLVIVDVGCRWGFADAFLGIDSDALILGFDPDEEECARLNSLYKAQGLASVRCLPYALGSHSHDAALHITKEPACSSVYPPIDLLWQQYPALDCIKPTKTVSTRLVSLTEVLDQQNVSYVDYLKLDTQGSELDILKGAKELLTSISCIDVEVEFNPIYAGQNLFHEVDVFLRASGFELWNFSNLVHYSKNKVPQPQQGELSTCFDLHHRYVTPLHPGQLFWADARYINPVAIRAALQTPSGLKKTGDLFRALKQTDVMS